MTAITTITGSNEDQTGARWIVLLDLFVARLLPGSILVVSGLLAIGLGLYEVIAPQAFDQFGGGFLEVLFGGR